MPLFSKGKEGCCDIRASRGKTASGRTFVVVTGSLSNDRTEEYPHNVFAAVSVSTAHGASPTATENRCVSKCEETVAVGLPGLCVAALGGCFVGVYPVVFVVVIVEDEDDDEDSDPGLTVMSEDSSRKIVSGTGRP